MLESTGIVNVGSHAIAPALLSPSPKTRLKPTPRKLIANPLTTWSAWKLTVTSAWSRLSAPAANMA